MTKVKNYTTEQLLERVEELKSFEGLPKDYWILGVQSEEDTYNEFDDKFYLFYNDIFVYVVTGTTNAGTTGLLHYDRYINKGVAVIKTDEWYYDLWTYGLHHNKMPSLKQVNEIKYFRDWNKNVKIEEIGEIYEGKMGINFHTVTYQGRISFIKKFIGGWSTGCQVVNNVKKYYKFLDKVKFQDYVTYCLIKEF
jgi:hypothetical protein